MDLHGCRRLAPHVPSQVSVEASQTQALPGLRVAADLRACHCTMFPVWPPALLAHCVSRMMLQRLWAMRLCRAAVYRPARLHLMLLPGVSCIPKDLHRPRRTADAGPLRRREASEYMRVMNTNTVGSFRVTQALYPLLKKRETRTIVNVSSGAGSITLNRGGMKDLSGKIVAYASSKAALNMRARPGPCAGPGHASPTAAPGMHASRRCLAPMRPSSCRRLWHPGLGSAVSEVGWLGEAPPGAVRSSGAPSRAC